MNRLLEQIRVRELRGDPTQLDITGIEHDSRRVRRGQLFCCLPGHVVDGHRFAADAVSRGAAALLCEHLVDPATLPPGRPVVQAAVGEGEARPAMAALAAAFFDHPARALRTVGVTGTNGKTTVTHLVAACLEAAGRPTTVVGTLTGARTTPESTELQAILAEVRDRQAADGTPRAVSMEVSSHALAQSRVDAITFDVAVFTNLSRDHLDYHATMADYGAAKARLFEPARAATGVVWAEDQFGRTLLHSARIPMVAVTRDMATAVTVGVGGSTFTWRGRPVATGLTGAYNVDNALLAAEAALAAGVPADAVVTGLGRAPAVPGRMEVVATPSRGDRCTVLVDYAHTPAALATVLAEARSLAGPDGRVLVVFGCGGDRDAGKRPEMGAVAGTLADLVWVTSDNPRHEDPSAIIGQVVAGVPAGTALAVEPDRAAAITDAVTAARPADVVVVAGKGHETYQQIGDDRRPFDDRLVASAAARGD